jgi:hypothetical protein
MAANANHNEKLRITQFAIVPASIEKMSRIQLLAWVNTVLKSQYTSVEQLHTGDAYCLLNNVLFPDSIPMPAVKWNSNHEADSLINWRLLQRDWMRRGVDVHRVMQVDRIVLGKYAANYEFLRFFKAFFDANSDGIPRDAVAMRNGLQLPFPATPATPIGNGRGATPGLLGAARASVSHGLLAPTHTQAKTNGTLGNNGNMKNQMVTPRIGAVVQPTRPKQVPDAAKTLPKLDDKGGRPEAIAGEEQAQPTDKNPDQQLAVQTRRFLPSAKTVVISTGGAMLIGATIYAGYKFFIKGEGGDGGGK